jgi:transcription initiation factor IIE alpha subunit
MKNVSPHYFKCEKCGSVIHRVDNDRLNDIIWLRNRGGKGYKHTRLESDIINAVPPVDGEYKVY